MSSSIRAGGETLKKLLAALGMVFLLATPSSCSRPKQTLRQRIDSLPDADTGQLLNPVTTAEIPAKKVKVGDDTKDSWVLKTGEALQAQAKCRGELGVSFALLSRGQKSGTASVEIEVSSAAGKKIKKMDLDMAKSSPGWKNLGMIIGSGTENDCTIRLSFAVTPPQSGQGVFMAVANSRIYTPGAASKMNVLIINIDTLRRDHCGIYKYRRATTPSIDMMAARSLVFDNMVSSSSFTVPSVGSLFTSLYPSGHGAIGKDEMTLNKKSISENNLTLAELLEKDGYHTAAFSASPFISPEFGFGQGFEFFSTTESAHADALYDKAMPWLDTHYHEQPFFVYVMFFDPHQPYDPPASTERQFQKDYLGYKIWPDSMLKNKPVRVAKLSPKITPVELEFAKSMYDSEISYVDQFVGLILQKMETTGLLDRTMVIITSDHGEEFLEHGGFGHSRTLYSESIDVPFILYYPGISAPGKKIPSLVRNVDVMPTVLDLLGIKPPPKIRGRSLRPLFENSEALKPVPAFSELKSFLKPGEYLRALTNPEDKLIVNLPSRKLEFYDLAKDPHEKTDISAQSPELAKARLSEMDALQKSFVKIAPGKIKKPSPDQQKLLRAQGYTK
jgi:arylsulfatase A-like enzyme